MTPPTPDGYTDLDLLKQITAQGLISAESIEKVLSRFIEQNPDFANNQDLKLAIRHADVMKAQLLGANGERVLRSDDPDRYSDGRPVKTPYSAGDQEFEHIWYADPNHPHNQPGALPPSLVMTATGQVYNLRIAEPGTAVADELGNELEDRR